MIVSRGDTNPVSCESPYSGDVCLHTGLFLVLPYVTQSPGKKKVNAVGISDVGQCIEFNPWSRMFQITVSPD